jgi:uncharacterized membrane protein
VTTIEQYLGDLAAAVHVRGRARRRFLAECRDHLIDASADHSPDQAVRRFGDAGPVAHAFDTAVAGRRALAATVVAVVAVFAVAVSTDVVLHAADASTPAVLGWAVVFFAAAQTSAVSTVLAVVLAATMRREVATPADVALVVRRALTALASAVMTLFAAAAAVPGQAPAWQVLAGPVVALLAVGVLARAHLLVRAIEPHRTRVIREPFTDVLALLRRRGPTTADRPRRAVLTLGPTVVVAAAAAFAWDHLDQGTLGTSATAAGIEAALTVAGFVLLGGGLGVRPAVRSHRHG